LNLNENTDITIPIRNLLAIAVGISLFLAQFFLITGRISVLEEDNRKQREEIEAANTFRYQWLRGELGMVGIDIEQNIRLNHIEKDVATIIEKGEKHEDDYKTHN
jgi:hypothetical protein